MVDFSTYKELHTDPVRWRRDAVLEKLIMPEKVMECEEPPPEPEIYPFPPTIIGYNLRHKRWSNQGTTHRSCLS